MFLVATCISAIANISLNFCLIPVWQEKAAAFTTFVAEFIMFLLCMVQGLKVVKIHLLNKNMLGILSGCMAIVGVCRVTLWFNLGTIMQLLISILTSGIVYGLLLIIFHNEIIYAILRKVFWTHEK